MSKLLTIKETADKLSVHYMTLRKWALEGKIPSTVMPGGRLRFDEAQIEKFLESRTTNLKKLA